VQNYKPGTDVPLTFSLTDESGSFITPISITWRVLDEAEVVLQDWAAAAVPGTSDLKLTIPLALTSLTPPALRAIRTVEVEVITATGTVYLSDAIMLQGATALAFGVNSFQTYAQALLVSEDFTTDSMAGWSASDRETREKAMIQSYGRILLLPISRMAVLDEQSVLASPQVFGPALLRDMTAAQMLQLEARFLSALRSAQLVEADEILAADPVIAARQNGVTGMTVGQSTMFFRQRKTLDLPIGTRALKYLERYVRFGARIGRS
jgi:hypothetical protein